MKTYDEMQEIIMDTDDDKMYYSDEFKQSLIAEIGDIVADKPAFAEKIIALAWKEGHFYGFNDIFCYLDELVDLTR